MPAQLRSHVTRRSHIAAALATVMLFSISLSIAVAQTQESKPEVPSPPVAEHQQQQPPPPIDDRSSGVTGERWEGPNWGVRISWDATEWVVEAESIQLGYDGLQMGTPRTTVFIEAYEGFSGDADACLADAQQEIGRRDGVIDVVTLQDRPLPVAEDVRGPAQLFGVTASLADGTPYRGIEYVECRTIVPGVAVVEITWQGVIGAFNEDFPGVEALLATLELPPASTPLATPGAAGTPSVPPQATPVA